MGKFITFEGGEGSGKTTHLDSVAKYLREHGFKVQTTHDPGGAPISIGIRPFLLDKKYKVCRGAELLLYLAARAELVDKVILPMLPHVDFLLCDRYYDSTAVYQGIIREWGKIWAYDEPFLQFMHRLFSRDLEPDYTFLFDVNPVLGLNRSKGYEKDESRWEEEGLTIHKKINDAFLDCAADDPNRFIVIDANMEIEDVLAETLVYFDEEIIKHV